MIKKPHSIVLVEDHVIVRTGLKELIEHIGDFKVIAEYDHGRQLIDNISNIHPDLIIMDISMPVMDGPETMKWLKENDMDYYPVLILTLETSDKTIIELYKWGVRGYLSKTCTAEILHTAITDILTTGHHHNSMLTTALAHSAGKNTVKNVREMIASLTEREVEIIRMVCNAEEYTYEQIAKIMGLHRRTIDNYRDSIFKKLDVKSKTGLVMFAMKHGLLPE